MGTGWQCGAYERPANHLYELDSGVPDSGSGHWRPEGGVFCTSSGSVSERKAEEGMSEVWETHTPEETWRLGYELGEKAGAKEVYCLDGDLGVGKTVFAQGFAAGLGIQESVNSPTFTIVQEYDQGRLPFYHFDVYRIGDVEEMEEIGYEDYFFGEGVCLIEWPSLISEILPDTAVWVLIEKEMERGFDFRRICVKRP